MNSPFSRFGVRVPATTANLGAGFDCLGLALSLHNELEIFPSGLNKLGIEGEGAGELPSDDSNLVLKTFQKVANFVGRELPPIRVLCRNRIPLARGMGSSAAALVSSAVAANRLFGDPLSHSQILRLVVEEEGHSDNVAPALVGGLVVCGQRGDDPVIHRVEPVREIKVVLLIPDFLLETAKAREAMPEEVPLVDAVVNLQNTALTAMAFASGDYSLLESSLIDRIHQPYRRDFIPGFEKVLAAARSTGAYGAALSGAGPAIAAFTVHHAEEVAEAMERGYEESGQGGCRTLVLETDMAGTVLSEL